MALGNLPVTSQVILSIFLSGLGTKGAGILYIFCSVGMFYALF